MQPAVERLAGLQDALEALDSASRLPAKQRTAKVSGIVDVVCRHAFEDGLDEEALRTVVHITSRKTELDQTSVTTLVKNLYPAQRVSADVVVAIVAALGQGKGKPSPSTQNGFVKWLIIVHEIIENPDVLSRLYGVLFGMLDMISIRTSLCHLLSLITRRKHVKPFRIQNLLELSRNLGNEPALQGLLRIYKDYYPEILLGSTSTSRNSFPPRPDSEWRERLREIQDRSATASDAILDQQSGFKVVRKGPKKIKPSAIPDVHTYHTHESSVTLEGIDNVEDFVAKFDKIEPPGQLISFLTDPLLQKYVDLKPSPITSRRIELWLSTCLEEQFNSAQEGSTDTIYLSEILDGLFRHARYTKTLLPITQAFLREYLLVWDGLQNVDSILGLLSFAPMQPFAEAYATFLQPAERALTAQHPDAFERLVRFYTDLLQQWMNQATPQRARPSLAFQTPDQRSLFDLVSHVSDLATSLLLSVQPSSYSSITSAILTFFELLSASSVPHRIPILLPPIPLFYLLTLSPSAVTLSRTAGLLGDYKSAFNVHPSPIKDYYSQADVDAINCAIRDVYNLLWINRALSAALAEDGSIKSLGLHCSPPLREALNSYLGGIDHEYAIQAAFGLSNNPWLASLSAAAWRDLEEREVRRRGYDRRSVNWHKGPVSQRSLEVSRRNGGVDVDYEAYRVHVLKWLGERGSRGMKDFLFASSDALKRKYGDDGG